MKVIKIKFLFVFFLTLSELTFAENSLNQIIIEADKSIEYFEKKGLYIASGNVQASKNNFFLKASIVHAFMNKKKPSTIASIKASGDVMIRKNDDIAKAQFATYNFDLKLISLKGKLQSVESKKFKIFAKKFITFDDLRKVAISEGEVKLYLEENVNIFSNKMIANFNKKDNILINAIASGDVKITTKLETITCNSAKYIKKTGLITLIGNVKIMKNNNVISGEKGFMNLKTRKSSIISGKSNRVKGIFAPSK